MTFAKLDSIDRRGFAAFSDTEEAAETVNRAVAAAFAKTAARPAQLFVQMGHARNTASELLTPKGVMVLFTGTPELVHALQVRAGLAASRQFALSRPVQGLPELTLVAALNGKELLLAEDSHLNVHAGEIAEGEWEVLPVDTWGLGLLCEGVLRSYDNLPLVERAYAEFSPKASSPRIRKAKANGHYLTTRQLRAYDGSVNIELGTRPAKADIDEDVDEILDIIFMKDGPRTVEEVREKITKALLGYRRNTDKVTIDLLKELVKDGVVKVWK
jgi:hypothetical protein